MSVPLVEGRGLAKTFRARATIGGRGGKARAVDGVDLTVTAGECVGLVGESGSGKSTLGRLLVRLVRPTAGRVLFDGDDLAELGPRDLRSRRRDFQMIFQDPLRSLNPRMRIGDAVAEPLEIHGMARGAAREARVAELLDRVGLGGASFPNRRPHELSGGQRQRVGIARALATGPRFVVADEPVSALDVSVQAQVVNLLDDLRRELGLALLFIAHDLAVVEQIADRIEVMYAGRIVESGPREVVVGAPSHPYTVSLIRSVPRVEPGRPRAEPLPGEPPSPTDPASGCAFHPRCPVADERCSTDRPQLVSIGERHRVACHFPDRVRIEQPEPRNI